MKLDLECSWNQKQKKVKQSIHFDFRPKLIFSMPDEVTTRLQQLMHSIGLEGPPALQELKSTYEQYPKSVYAGYVYHRALLFFELFEEADELYQELRSKFEDQLFIKSIEGYQLLKKKKSELRNSLMFLTMLSSKDRLKKLSRRKSTLKE